MTIQDQYTNRTDLTPGKKWLLRNPGYSAKASRSYRARHPDSVKKRNNAVTLKRIKKRLVRQFYGGPNKAYLAREVKGLAKRGKSIADICIWLNMPMSMVQKFLNTP